MATSKINPPSCYSQIAITRIVSAEWTCNANSTKEITATGSKSGWYPVAVVGMDRINDAQHYLYGYELTASSGSATVTAWVRNTSSSAITDKQQFDILWVKEG